MPEYIWAMGNKNSEIAFGIMFKGQKRLVMSTFPRITANEELYFTTFYLHFSLIYILKTVCKLYLDIEAVLREVWDEW